MQIWGTVSESAPARKRLIKQKQAIGENSGSPDQTDPIGGEFPYDGGRRRYIQLKMGKWNFIHTSAEEKEILYYFIFNFSFSFPQAA
jgi:hypothetical protein